MWWMFAGREVQTDGPASENARSPNLVTVGETVYWEEDGQMMYSVMGKTFVDPKYMKISINKW